MELGWPHIHLMINHLPVLGTVFGLALLAVSMIFGGEGVKKAALWTFVVSAFFAAATFLTGDEAEDLVKGIACVADKLIGEHEEAAEGALTGSVTLGLLAATFLLQARGGGRVGKIQAVIILIGALAVSGVMAWTADLGGRIHHQELRPGYADSVSQDHNGDDAHDGD